MCLKNERCVSDSGLMLGRKLREVIAALKKACWRMLADLRRPNPPLLMESSMSQAFASACSLLVLGDVRGGC